MTATTSSRSTNRAATSLALASLVPLATLGLSSRGSLASPGYALPAAACALVIVLTVVLGSSLRTSAGPNGVTAQFGPLGWPEFHYPIARIRHVDVVSLPAGFWARGVWWSPSRGLVLTLRSGPALRLELHGGRRVTIGWDDPATARDVLHFAGVSAGS